MSTQSVSNENIVVLNSDYQYDSSKQTENAKWVDLNNVMSVKRDKTIYAVRARNTFDFSKGSNNTVFFANTSTAYQLPLTTDGDYGRGQTFNSNIYRGFGTVLDGDVENIFMTAPANMYGNLSDSVSANLTQLGIGGSLLETNFEYGMNGSINNSINVQSNVRIFGNLLDANQSLGLPSSFNILITGNTGSMTTQQASGNLYSNVDGNTCYQKIFYNTDSPNQWNRLINANINSNVCVNASTDPCDQVGNPNPIVVGGPTNAQTNEAYRHQFQLKKNSNSLAYQDPIYIARVSRFGKNLSDLSGGIIASNVSLHSFTGSFAASIPTDNSLYANGNTISSINITGNINSLGVTVFNSNFLTGNLYSSSGLGDFNGNRTDNNVSDLLNNKRYLNIQPWAGASVADYVTGGSTFSDSNGDILPSATFKEGDRPGFVQANIGLDQGYILLDRISFQNNDPTFIKSSQVFSADETYPWNSATYTSNDFDTNSVTANYSKLWFQSPMIVNNTVSQPSAQYIVLKGNSIVSNNWNANSLMTPKSTSMPTATGNPNLSYLPVGNTINLYLRQGNLSMNNYTYVDNKTLTGVKYLTSVPGFVNSVILPAGNITLSANVLEAPGTNQILGTNQTSLAFNSTSTLSVNTTYNYNFIFSGNTKLDERVVLNSNLVMPVNNANSFIAACWNYDNSGNDIYGTANFPANLRSNVSIHYGNYPTVISGETIQTLNLNSDLAKQNIQYNLEFVNVTGESIVNVNGESNAAAATPGQNNYGFAPNLSVVGGAPSTTVTNSTQVPTPVLNNNKSINSMQLENVAKTEYTFDGSLTLFTDVGKVIASINKGTNFNTAYILPSASLNINNGTPNPIAEFSQNDSFINIITEYIDFNSLIQTSSTTDYTHEVTCYDFEYRYSVSSVDLSGHHTISNEIYLNGMSFAPENLYSSLGNNGVSPTNISGPIEAAEVTCYVYENMDYNTNLLPEQIYPFTLPDDSNLLVDNTTVHNLFPGFQWKNVAGGYQYFQNKTASHVDFVLPNNSTSAKTALLTVHSHDTVTGTMKVSLYQGLSTGSPKIIAINPIPLGTAANGDQLYSTPVVCGVQGEANTYVIFMIECAGPNSNSGLTDDISQFLPAKIHINIHNTVGNNVNEVSCKAALRVMDGNNMISQENFTFNSPASLFNYASPSTGSNSIANLKLNVFSIPSNGSIVSIIYKQTLIDNVLSYTSQNFILKGESEYLGLPINSSSTNFAWSFNNTSNTNSITDPNWEWNMKIPAQTTRYYLESIQTGIFIDVSNFSQSKFTSNLPALTVYRSVEWVLTRSWVGQPSQIVGRGLLSKYSSSSITQNFLIYENLLSLNNLPGSGYTHNLSGNLNDLCTRCVLQSIQTSSVILNGSANKNNWLIKTKSDDLNITLMKMVPGSLTLAQYVKQADIPLTSSGISIDLGYLFAPEDLETEYAGTIGVIKLGPVRGFGYNSSAGANSVSSFDLSKSLFTYLIQPDNYALVKVVGSTTGQVMTYQDVAFTEETQVTATDNPNLTIASSNLTLSLEDASLAYQYISPPYQSPALSNSSFVLIGSYTNGGYGKVQYFINDFTSNYETELETLTLKTGDLSVPILGDSSEQAFKVSNTNPSNTLSGFVNIRWDPAAVNGAGKYFIYLDENYNTNPGDKFYFRGTGELSLPTQLDGNTTLLLYTGLRPLILNVLDVATVSNLESVITDAALFNWNETDTQTTPTNSRTPNIFTSTTAALVCTGVGNHLSAQYYQIVLTNQAAAIGNKSILFRSNKYTPTANWVASETSTNPNQNFFGSYVNASSLFDTLRLNIGRDSGINTTYNLTSTMRLPLENPQKSDDAIIAGALANDESYASSNNNLFVNNGSASFVISGINNPQTLGDLFTMTIQGYLQQTTGFQLNILASTLTLYTALDINNNGEIDISGAENVDENINGLSSTFGLQDMFSELNFKLPFGNTQYVRPAVLTSWTLDRKFHSVLGAPFDMNLNNMFAVGYNLDCFFTIRNNIAAEFDVITIATAATTNPNAAKPNVSTLVVQGNTAPLIIANPNDWARSITTGAGVIINPADSLLERSGLTFKLKSGTTNVKAGDIVRLYVDNAIASNNLEWSVTVANKAPKTYQLYAYDQDRYSALLDEQLNISNSFN